MDPATALGVAAATVQFISFTGDVISKSREIYHSADGVLLSQNELETISKSLKNLCRPLRIFSRPQGRVPNEMEIQLRDLCRQCIRVADELEQAIDKLKIHGAHHQKWKSFRQALNSVRKEADIEQLSRRLDRYRNQIDTTLLFILRYFQHGHSSSLIR